MLDKTALLAPEPAAERASRIRQRRKLIDACISALHTHGPSRTTVEKVVAIAGMSPGIVNFYFDSKAAMLVEALRFLSEEFESRVLEPVSALRDDPVRALELLVDLYLDPEIASPRKVSVWYSFWGEASSRKEYFEICGKKDDTFAALVLDLIGQLTKDGGEPHQDADALALGLIGAFEVLWQTIAFQDEANVDRTAAKNRCLAYLRSVFPRQFGGGRPAVLPAPVRATGGGQVLPGWAYADAAVFAREASGVFQGSWQFAGHEAELPNPGDYLTIEILGERAMLLRGADRAIVALGNSCTRRPHALARGRTGHFNVGIVCPVDGERYGLDDLTRLDLVERGGFLFVRLGQGSGVQPPALDPIERPALLAASDEVELEADWKVVVEYWLDQWFKTVEPAPAGIVECRDGIRRWLLLYPNLLLDIRSNETIIRQVLPLGPGRSRLRCFIYGPAAGNPPEPRLADDIEAARSTQTGLTAPGYVPPEDTVERPAVLGFIQWLRAAVAMPDQPS